MKIVLAQLGEHPLGLVPTHGEKRGRPPAVLLPERLWAPGLARARHIGAGWSRP
ncbi:hypothetical protein GPZ77_33205 [Streptomyces sp. QHH-9511]|uniref:hypothetical protein n=1 Tax=Streptomyces sp. QHH-9511 TaxID=2684468 RepID=UPI001319AB14|nr:hypothetical protein [Streptomyces sp. QHH-9511]QGZ52527.1 hypothetical protein GPZ77_33205 [Streptomyces sp. QHH-9511]